jgi:hypothetical protein
MPSPISPRGLVAAPVLNNALPPRPQANAAATPAPSGGGSIPALANLGLAVSWRPGQSGLTGTQANLRVTATYQALDEAMTRFLGEPQLPNWMTYGKYASREVGAQVIRLEELMKVSGRYDEEAAWDTFKDFLGDPTKLGGQGIALLKLSHGNPFQAAQNATTIRDALVAGNTGVYMDIAPAYDLFLKAEAAGQDGVAALRNAGWGQAPKDSQGLLLDAFTLYQRAARERATLTPEERHALIQRATLTIGNHEQMVILQGPRMFGNPEVAYLLSSLSALLTVTDARGTQRLLPYGGNWADFATRMGYDDVPAGTPGAMKVFDHQGVEHNFIPSRNPRRWQGTIGQYFVDGMAPSAARIIITGKPAPLPGAYDGINQVERTRTWVRERLRQPLFGARPNDVELLGPTM